MTAMILVPSGVPISEQPGFLHLCQEVVDALNSSIGNISGHFVQGNEGPGGFTFALEFCWHGRPFATLQPFSGHTARLTVCYGDADRSWSGFWTEAGPGKGADRRLIRLLEKRLEDALKHWELEGEAFGYDIEDAFAACHNRMLAGKQ